VRKLPEGAQIQLEGAADGGQVTLKAGRSKFSLATLPREDFPATAGGDLPNKFSIAGKDLRNLIDRTRFAISTEETRYYLNGIYLHAHTTGDVKVLRAVATDGHRLARFEMALPSGAADMPGVIVPRKAVGELRKLIEETSDNVEVALSDSKIRFGFDAVLLNSKLIDGTFPDYQRVIPTGNDKVMEVDRKSFAEAVDRVSTISSEKSRAVKMSLKAGTLTLSASSPESGSASEELEVKYGGTGIDIGFNSRYLLDITSRSRARARSSLWLTPRRPPWSAMSATQRALCADAHAGLTAARCPTPRLCASPHPATPSGTTPGLSSGWSGWC